MPTIDGGWLDQHERFRPPGPEPPQKQPKQPVSGPKVPIRTSEDVQLVAQSKNFDQEAPTCRGWLDRTRPEDISDRP